MKRRGNIKYIAGLMILVLIVIAGSAFTKKAIAAARVKLVGFGVEPAEELKLQKILLTGIKLRIMVELSNYSDTALQVEQISIDAFTQKGNKLANQTQPLAAPVSLTPNANTTLFVNYQIDYTNVLALLKDNGILKNIKDALTILKNIVSKKEIGTNIKLKGFIVAEGVKVNINEETKI